MKKRLICIIFAIMLLCTGCNKDKYSGVMENTLYITKEHPVIAVTFHDLGAYGDINTFNLLDDNRMTAYNYSVKGISVKRNDSKVEDGRIKLVTEYNNFLAYDGYNGIKFMTGTIKEALVAHDFADAEFILKTMGTAISTETVLENQSYYVVIIEQGMRVEVAGEIIYYSKNVSVVDDNTAITAYDGKSYIVFK